MHDYLTEIIRHKQQEIAALKQQVEKKLQPDIQAVLSGNTKIKPKKSLKQVLYDNPPAIIAEVNRKSPSKGHLAEIADPVALAQCYAQAGAAAISVLTDPYGFNGSITDLQQIAIALANSPCAILRKDFIIDPIQIAEAILAGADAILLIVSVLQTQTQNLLNAAKQMGIDAIVEVHDQSELKYAIEIGAEIIGVNNRNLTSFEVDLNTAKNLFPLIPAHIISIAESGIHSANTAQGFFKLGYHAALIGEALVQSDNPATMIAEMRKI